MLEASMKYNNLNPEEERVIINKGTEAPFSGDYLNNKEQGIYQCKRCDAKLYRSDDKFNSGCGWPSFDDEIPGAVKHIPDADGVRTEIVCANCGGHLGHVFTGEGFTKKNTRHCVNSVSIRFCKSEDSNKASAPKIAIFAAGCFWGVEHLMRKEPGVLSAQSGYTGGATENPRYNEVCSGSTGHYEAVKVEYDPEKISFEQLTKLFFEIHDFSQQNGQGPDIGDQYRSAIFYNDDHEKQTAQKVIDELKQMGHSVATTLHKAQKFWPAEEYHQEYYAKTGKTPYCHTRKKIFSL